MKRTYEVRDRADKRAIREFLKREGQFLLPVLELVEQTEVAIDEVIQVMGRATIEAVLEMSAEGVAGVKQAGRSRAEDDTVWYGRQGGVVYLSDRKVRVERPRLRRRGAGEGGEVEVPAYAAMRRPGAVADRMLEVLMAGVSTRKYGRVIGEMADTVGVSKSAVSRETVEASERVLKELMERRLDAWGSSPELCVKVRGSSSMLRLGCLGDLLRFEKREIEVAAFAPDRSSPQSNRGDEAERTGSVGEGAGAPDPTLDLGVQALEAVRGA